MGRFLVEHGNTRMAVPGIFVEDINAVPLFIFFEVPDDTKPVSQSVVAIHGVEALVDYGDGRVLRQRVSTKRDDEITTLECVDLPFSDQSSEVTPDNPQAWAW